MTTTAEFTEEEASAFAKVFNQNTRTMARRMKADTLLSAPRGDRGKDGWFCEYALVRRRSGPVLILYNGHRMTNDCYCERAQDGSIVFSWSRWTGVPFSGYAESYLKDFRRAQRNGRAAAIRVGGP